MRDRAKGIRSFVLAMIGPIGSGKTYVARILARRLGAQHVRTDDIRMRLARHGKPISRAITLANRLHEQAVAKGRSVILDFDAVRSERQREIKALGKHYGARVYFIRVKAPERVILERLRAQHYPIPGVFNDVQHALLAYFNRRRFHRKKLRVRPLFVIDNGGSKPLGPQIDLVVKRIKGL